MWDGAASRFAQSAAIGGPATMSPEHAGSALPHSNMRKCPMAKRSGDTSAIVSSRAFGTVARSHEASLAPTPQ